MPSQRAGSAGSHLYVNGNCPEGAGGAGNGADDGSRPGGDYSEWELLAELCSSSLNPVLMAADCPELRLSASQYKGSAAAGVRHVYAAVGVSLNEVMWSMTDLAFKVILDIGCMRSVAGT